MSPAQDAFASLREVADADVVAAMEARVLDAHDPALNRINVLEFAEAHGLREDEAIGAFVRAARLGLFDMAWNLLCPGCGGLLESAPSLRSVSRDEYDCALCAAGYRPTLDEMVEVSFTVNPRVRRIAAHDPDALSMVEYNRQVYWSCGVRLPEGELFDELLGRIVIGSAELPAGERAVLSLELPAEFLIVFDPVSHVAQFIDVRGERTAEDRALEVVLSTDAEATEPVVLRPGPLRLTLDNRMDRRAVPAVWIAGDDLHDLLGRRKPFLTAQRLFTNQTFRDIYGSSALDIDQRLNITSMTFLFTDLKGSTALYERIGDLAAFDLVKAHFRTLHAIVADESGAVVKTIGDAVMATFPAPHRGLAAALRMREELQGVPAGSERGGLTIKIGLHEGPCLAVTLNERLDYFGQTVNIAARVQGLAMARSIFATRPVVTDPLASELLDRSGLAPVPQECALQGISDTYTVYEIP